MTLVKICGITSVADAFACVDAGVDALGFNFYPRSPRFINPQLARQIIEKLPTYLMTVGVFVNEKSPSVVEELAAEAGVNALQLHGDESPDYCAALSGRFVIKALRVNEEFKPASVTRFKVDSIMLDGFHPELRGGTGRLVDWTIASRTRALVAKLFLAGGLSPDNVASAIAAVNPYAVDACSALETVPGKKDADSIRAFVRAARGSALNIDAPH